MHARARVLTRQSLSRSSGADDREVETEVEGEARMEQARSKLSVMVRLHNETAQRHGAICRQLETKRLALETLQRQLEQPTVDDAAPDPARESSEPRVRQSQEARVSGQRVLQVVVEGRSDFLPIAAHQAQFLSLIHI